MFLIYKTKIYNIFETTDIHKHFKEYLRTFNDTQHNIGLKEPTKPVILTLLPIMQNMLSAIKSSEQYGEHIN